MRFPVDQPYQITTHFDPINHPGIDIAPTPGGTTGRSCLSPENSTVHTAGFVAALEGNYVILQGESGFYYYFGHFATQMATKGQRFNEGQQIGIIGMTGLATGIHTHHEVRPTPYSTGQIDPEQYYKKGAGVDKIDVNLSRIISHGILGRNGLRGRAYSLDGTAGDPWIGADLNAKFIYDVFNSPEAQQWRDSHDANSVNGINATIDQVNALKIENQQLKDQLASGGGNYVPAPPMFIKKEVKE